MEKNKEMVSTTKERLKTLPETSDSNIIIGLICPVCGHKSAWVYSQSPWIFCNRIKNCGVSTYISRLQTLKADEVACG